MTFPPGRDRDVLQHCLSAVSKARAFTAQHFRFPQSLLTTKVAESLLLPHPRNHQKSIPNFSNLLQDRKLVFPFIWRSSCSLRRCRHPRGRLPSSGSNKVRKRSTGGFIPSSTSRVVFHPLASSTVMTPSLPTLFMASAIIFRWSHRCCGGDGSNLGDLSDTLVGLLNFLQLLDDLFNRKVSPAFHIHGSGTLLQPPRPLHNDRLCRDSSCSSISGVEGFAGDLLHHLGAHVLENFLFVRSLFCHSHAILSDRRRPEGFL